MMAWNVVDSKMAMGDVLVALNRRDEARRYYTQASELIESIGSKAVASNQEETRAAVRKKLAALDDRATSQPSPATTAPTTAPAGR